MVQGNILIITAELVVELGILDLGVIGWLELLGSIELQLSVSQLYQDNHVRGMGGYVNEL